MLYQMQISAVVDHFFTKSRSNPVAAAGASSGRRGASGFGRRRGWSGAGFRRRGRHHHHAGAEDIVAATAIGPFAIALEFAHVIAEDFARAQGGDQIVELASFFVRILAFFVA